MRLTTILGKSCLTLLVAASACHGLHQQRSPLPEPIVLIVRNDGFFDVYVVASRRSGTNGWAVFGHNASAGDRTITARVYCLAP